MAIAATDAQLPALTAGVSGLDVASLSLPREIEIPFIQNFLPMVVKKLSWATGEVNIMMAPFETVKFVSLSFSVEVSGQTGKLQFAATTSSDPPDSEDDWIGATVFQRFSGNAHGDTYAEYVFPSRHPFGLELKATTLGNDPPNFFFRFKGGTGCTASIRGKLVIRGGGHGIIKATRLIDVTPKA
ncbi:hypothetical protein [Soybean leaf-associated mycoflexivirus 1]|jgi:hypothetical protein|uniref:Uncharacterized protein n=1 Tax=Soybean leaf-associated mycoflexivirus 1 TaxID=1719047 RepID=A0A0S1WF58_9VIRU|nr:hypothetical protein [Soybean leaf-associated mycoflexivirus 1]ALM62224.1 hypothetical protein [Soybean leaf-associated mycoflexivirus 1]